MSLRIFAEKNLNAFFMDSYLQSVYTVSGNKKKHFYFLFRKDLYYEHNKKLGDASPSLYRHSRPALRHFLPDCKGTFPRISGCTGLSAWKLLPAAHQLCASACRSPAVPWGRDSFPEKQILQIKQKPLSVCISYQEGFLFSLFSVSCLQTINRHPARGEFFLIFRHDIALVIAVM